MPLLDQKYQLLEVLKTADTSLGLEAHYHARFNLEVSRADFKKISSFNRDPARWDKIATHAKTYGHADTLDLQPVANAADRNLKSDPRDLPEPELPETANILDDAKLKSTILRRHAGRSFDGRPVSRQALSDLLMLGYGKNPVRAEAEVGRPAETQRTVASGGCRMPIEIYPVIINVPGLEKGFYHYNVNRACLELIDASDDPAMQLKQRGYDGDRIFVENAAVVLILTGVFERTTMKYGSRGWRFVHLDAGHVGQNLWLTATGLGLECTAYGGGFDSEIAKLLKFNQGEEGLLVSYIVGGPRPS